MHPFNRDNVDPSVSDEEIEQALDTTTPAPFPDTDDDQDDLGEAGGGEGEPAGIKERCANAKRLRDDQTFVGVNRCLAVVRGPILGIAALYPTAAIAGDHSEPFHSISDPASTNVPRGAIGFAWNDGAGHTWLELGSIGIGTDRHTLVSTTDFHRNGFEGVALRSRMLTWCGATRWGWGESVNGVDVWPAPHKPKPKPLTLEERIKRLQADRQRALDHGNDRYAARLWLWIGKLKARQ